ncbi:MAG TPA: hypothetical protein VGI64_22470 [Streptosporangiaceae bacterium]
MAAWSGRVVHPLAQFAALSRPASGVSQQPPPWEVPPEAGRLAPAVLTALTEVLAAHTSTPGRCYFCTWEGYGQDDEPGSQATITAVAPGAEAQSRPPPIVPTPSQPRSWPGRE